MNARQLQRTLIRLNHGTPEQRRSCKESTAELLQCELERGHTEIEQEDAVYREAHRRWTGETTQGPPRRDPETHRTAMWYRIGAWCVLVVEAVLGWWVALDAFLFSGRVAGCLGVGIAVGMTTIAHAWLVRLYDVQFPTRSMERIKSWMTAAGIASLAAGVVVIGARTIVDLAPLSDFALPLLSFSMPALAGAFFVAARIDWAEPIVRRRERLVKEMTAIALALSGIKRDLGGPEDDPSPSGRGGPSGDSPASGFRSIIGFHRAQKGGANAT